ncbi:MAG: hypothetical protein PHH08_04190, partial [Candidatus ainarchaeum sp.]|nr:hypothetical protein [Candidatus ainarchaeum sp.]
TVSMAQYAYDTTNVRDPRILPYFIIDSTGQGREGAFFQTCSIDEKGQKIVCGGNNIPFDQWANIPTAWQKLPNQFSDQRTPIFIYRDQKLPILYVFNEASNNSTAVKLWFNEPETMKFFEESYSQEGIKIFKIKKEAIAQGPGSQ